MFPIQDSVPSRSVPVVTRALILINAIVFFFELLLPQASVEQLFYLFGIAFDRSRDPAGFGAPHPGGLVSAATQIARGSRPQRKRDSVCPTLCHVRRQVDCARRR